MESEDIIWKESNLLERWNSVCGKINIVEKEEVCVVYSEVLGYFFTNS